MCLLQQMILRLNKSYYKLAMKHHPDKATGDEKLFKVINHAYDVLKNKDLRQKYDELRTESLTGIYIFIFTLLTIF